jgi:glucosamine-6-phosphate deaminase
VRVRSTAAAVARSVADETARLVAAKPTAVLGLPTGRTPIPLYRRLVRLHRRSGPRRLDLARVSTFNVDEFVGLASGDTGSYHAFMRAHLFDHVNIPGRQTHVLNGRAGDVENECARYERAIERAGGIDLQILGLGTNGHIGFNEPAAALAARTHRTKLCPATRRANMSLFGNRLAAVPKEGLSIGMATILGARRIILIATGPGKARAVERTIRGPVTPRLPASFLQLHPSVEVWLDREAASRLSAAPSTAPRRPRRSRP